MIYKSGHTCNLSLGEVLHQHSAMFEDDARVDIRTSGFWQCSHHKTFFDVGVSTVLLRPIAPQLLLNFFVSMRMRKVMPMRNAFMRLRTSASTLSFFLAVVE